MEEMNLEEMRNQFAILKEQLDKQEIVNDRLIRETMKAKIKDISDTKKFGYLAIAICLLGYPLFYRTHMTSLAFVIATCLILITFALLAYYSYRPVDRLNFMEDDLATVARVMAKFKKQSYKRELYSFPIMIPWIVWFCYEVGWKHGLSGINPWILSSAIVIGGIIGGIIGYSFYRKAMNAAQEIIDEIEKKE